MAELRPASPAALDLQRAGRRTEQERAARNATAVAPDRWLASLLARLLVIDFQPVVKEAAPRVLAAREAALRPRRQDAQLPAIPVSVGTPPEP